MYSEFDPNLKRKTNIPPFDFIDEHLPPPETRNSTHNHLKKLREERECGAFSFDLILCFIPHTTRRFKGGSEKRRGEKKVYGETVPPLSH
jgi:hypothetical protein